MIHDTPNKAEVALVIDDSNLVWRAYYGNKTLQTTKGEVSGHVFGAITMLLTAFRDLGSSLCPVFCYDGPGAKAERQKICPEYKADREERAFNPMPGAKELLINLPGVHIEQEGREGDDAIAYATQLCSKKQVLIFSGDADMWPLISDKVRVHSPNYGRLVEQSDWQTKYHVVDNRKIPIAKSLFGDSSDNIKGVERLIRKQVEPVLNDPQCVDIDSFYSMIVEKPASMTEKMWIKTKEAESRVRANYKVILPNIEGFSKNSVRIVLKNQENCDKLLDTLRKYECFSVLDRVKEMFN
jgi:hypothetical protein